MGVAKEPNTLMVVMLALLALALSGANAHTSSSPSSSSSSLSGLAVLVIEFDNDYENQVTIECGVDKIKDIELAPGKSYSIKVDLKNNQMDEYDCSLESTNVFVNGPLAYDGARDKGHMNIYWKINKVGLYRSYDKVHWIFEAKWSSID